MPLARRSAGADFSRLTICKVYTTCMEKITPTSSEEFLAIANSTDLLNLVIRGHQAIESVLNAVIAESLQTPHALEIERLSFVLKVDLGVAMGIITPDSRPSLLKLNGVRNRFAHRSNASLDQKVAADLYTTLSASQRFAAGKDIGPTSDPFEVLRHVMAVLFVEAENTLDKLRDGKLEIQIWHEMAQDVLKKSPVQRPDSPYQRRVAEDFQRRLLEKKSCK